MPCVLFRFYEELNDFLPPCRRKVDFKTCFDDPRRVGDAIESLGVPGNLVDLILVNGESSDLDRKLGQGDRVSVYPVFESLNIRGVSRVRPIPLRRPRFITDAHLGGLAKILRILGLDVCHDPGLRAPEIVALSRKEKRLIITTGPGFSGREDVTHLIRIRPGHPLKQAWRLLRDLDLHDLAWPFSRGAQYNGTPGDDRPRGRSCKPRNS